MMENARQKITSRHLARNAYLYIRQSTLRQVFENTESTKRQYDLRTRATALGWQPEQVVVIDTDLGQSGSSAVDREGFQKLVAEVGMGHAGIVIGLEVSRLARNSTDWHRLIEICALTDTLILDEDGLYEPNSFNDRLLLGLKGTMSEAELHVLRSRLRGGMLNKARRGELEIALPVGLVYTPDGRVTLDPDTQVQETIRSFFQAFRRAGSAMGVVRFFEAQSLLFPRRLRGGPRRGELIWGELGHNRALQVLHNPRYAGAYVFGRHRVRKTPDGRLHAEKLPREEWQVLLQDAHEGYIAWTEFEENQRRLKELAQAQGADRRRSPPREGPALLQGLAVCGVCGRRMTIRYAARARRRIPEYTCARDRVEHARPICQSIIGSSIDAAIGELLVETVTPVSLEVALAVQQEIQSRLEEADRLRLSRVERARYEADLAERRYMQVDPTNRLVAASLEAEWNGRLRALAEAREERERRRGAERTSLDGAEHSRILALAADFPRLWRDPCTPDRERKRMARLIIEDVTLTKGREITVSVRFRGGATRILTLPLPKSAWQLRQTPEKIVTEIDRLLDGHTCGQIAAILNERGHKSGGKLPFTGKMVYLICRSRDLKSRRERLRDAGMLTPEEMAEALGVSRHTIVVWTRHGLLKAHAHNNRNEFLYEPPGEDAPVKQQGWKLSERPRPEVASERTQEE